jgi:hypothetical protein
MHKKTLIDKSELAYGNHQEEVETKVRALQKMPVNLTAGRGK